MENGFEIDPTLLQALKDEIVLIKYGGNAMTDPDLSVNVYRQIDRLGKLGIRPVIVHGGGPAIAKLLDEVGVDSEFIGGHRRTDARTMRFVEMALSGQVNGEIVKGLNAVGVKAVGLSGKDAGMVQARRRIQRVNRDGREEEADLGYVGDVASVDPQLIHTLLGEGYLPVVAPVAVGSDRMDYNINADLFAGHLAGALHAAAFVAMTDVDGVRTDRHNPASRLEKISADELEPLLGVSIEGGMIPKIESCLAALQQGVRAAHIINGTRPDTLLKQLLSGRTSGTTILGSSDVTPS